MFCWCYTRFVCLLHRCDAGGVIPSCDFVKLLTVHVSRVEVLFFRVSFVGFCEPICLAQGEGSCAPIKNLASRPARCARLLAFRKGKGRQRVGAAGKGGVVKAGVPKFHVMITHYEVRCVLTGRRRGHRAAEYK